MIGESPRILVVTLYSGENEFDACISALKDQTYRNWDHRIIRNLPNKEAHAECYSAFMNAGGEFNLFLKLDADMVFTDNERLGAMVNVFEEHPGVDHATFSVHDWLSNTRFMGVHMYTRRARWAPITQDLFVDLDPTIPGQKLMFLDRPPAPVVVHGGDPSPFQAFHFGVHRALKTIHPNQGSLRYWINMSLEKWSLLVRIWKEFEATSELRRGLAVLGADVVMEGEVETEHYDYTNEWLREFFGRIPRRSSDELYDYLAPRWGTRLSRERRRLTALLRSHRLARRS